MFVWNWKKKTNIGNMKGKFFIIRENMNSSDKITIDMEGVSSLPSMFLNVSIGKFIDEFGFETLKKKISFTKITKLQAERLTDYISRYKR